MTDLTPPELILSDYQQLISDALTHMTIVSQGEMSDTSPAGFMRPFCGVMAFVGSELLYKANQTALAVAYSFLSDVVGVQQNPGVKAVQLLQFGLSTALVSDYEIPANFQVSDASGLFRFYTDQNLIIPSGAIAGTVTATAEQIGNTYNLGLSQINTYSQPLAYLSYVTNLSLQSKGTDAELNTDLIERAAVVLRNRNPVSGLDFEELAQIIMGDGSRCKAIGLLAADKISEQKGVVHLFLLDATGSPASDAVARLVGESIIPRLMLGTSLLTSPMELLDINVELIADVTGEITSQIIADTAWQTLLDYFNPKTYKIGSNILLEEVKYILRNNGGFSVAAVLLNGSSINIYNPNSWTLPFIQSLFIQLVDSSGNVFTQNYFQPSKDE